MGGYSESSWRSAPSSSQHFAGYNPSSSGCYYAQVEEYVNMQAQQMAAEYLNKASKEERHEEDKEKVFIVYKFIQTPIDALIAGM